MFPARPLLAATLAVFLFTQAAVAADGPPPDLLARAEKGDVAAEADLGVKYWRADGMPRDIKKALSWLNKAANKGSAKAQSALGEIYRDGKKHNEEVTDVKPDPKLAEKWFRKAAAQDDPEALYFVSTLTNDPKEKIALLEKAANAGHVDAQSTLGDIYGGLSPVATIEADVAKSVYWHDKAAHTYTGGVSLSTDDLDSQYALARRYLTGDGVEKDAKKAADLFRLVVAHNTFVDPYVSTDYEDQGRDAYLQLGLLYKNGQGVDKDDRTAVRWFTRAARLGSPQGWYYLGQAYEKGEGVAKDKLQAYLAYARLTCKPADDCAFADISEPMMKTPDPDPATLAAAAQEALVKSMSEAELAEAKQAAREESNLSFQLFNDTFMNGGFSLQP